MLPLALFKKVIESAKDSVVIATLDDTTPTRIIYVNDAFTAMTGYSSKEVIGHSPRMLHGPDTCSVTAGQISAALHRGEGVHRRIANYRKNGEKIWVDLQIFPLSGAGKGHFAAIQRDVTDMVGLVTDLAAATRSAAPVDRT